MPHFCNTCDHDTYICQACGRSFCEDCNKKPSTWATIQLEDGRSFNGNVCSDCIESNKYHDRKITISTKTPISEVK